MSKREWNKGNWEVDGEPVTYRVTYRSVDDGGTEHVEEFTNIDHGHDFFLSVKNSAGAYDATWEHVDPD
jgi:hypothetical protein